LLFPVNIEEESTLKNQPALKKGRLLTAPFIMNPPVFLTFTFYLPANIRVVITFLL